MAKDKIEIEVLAKGVNAAQKDIEKLKKSIEKTGSSTESSGSKMIKTFAAIAVGAFATFQALKKIAGISREFAVFSQSVKAMETQFGVSADKIIKKLGEVSKGTISNADLVQSANKAMALNVTKDIDQMAKLMEVARVRGQAMGLDTTQAFNDIVTGIGRGSPLILDNLGIITKGWAEEAKAAGQSMDAQFILNKVLSDGEEILKKTGEVALTDAEMFQQMEASAKNLRLAIGKELLPEFKKLTSGMEGLGKEGGTSFAILIRTIRVLVAVTRIAAVSITSSIRLAVAASTLLIAPLLTVINFIKDFKENGTAAFKGLGQKFKDDLMNPLKAQAKSAKKEFTDLGDSILSIFAKIDNGKKKIEGGGAGGGSTIGPTKKDTDIMKTVYKEAKDLANDFYNFLGKLRQADLEDTLSKLNEEREARLNAQGTARAELETLDEEDRQANIDKLNQELALANEIGNAELASETQRELKRLDLQKKQKAEEEKINKEFDAKIAAEKTKAAKKDKEYAIAKSLISTAVEVSKVISNPILAGIVAAAGLAQTGIIAKTPIPAFRQGTDFSPAGAALVGEAGPEIVELAQGSRVRTNESITNNSNDNRSTVINVQANNSIELVNDLQQTYGISVFEG